MDARRRRSRPHLLGTVVLPSLRGYRRAWLGPDLIAGLTLVAIAVPEQMATARLANLAAVTGLYAFVAGSLAFALLGTDRHLSVGADSTITPIFASGVVALAAVGTPGYGHLVSFLALVVGGLLVAVGLARLGWIADFLSAPVVTGILAGIAVEILVRQLPAVLGVTGGGSTTIGRIEQIVDQRGQANGWAFGIAAAVLAIVVVTEKLDRRIPGPLIGLTLSTVTVAVAGLKSHGVKVIGSIHAGLPAIGLPSVPASQIRHLAGPALTVAFVCIVQTAATSRSSASETSTAGDFNRDLVAVGAGSLLAGLSGTFAVNASPPRSAVVEAAGGRSQVSSLVAVGGVLAVLAFATALLRDLPEATLGAILVFVATRLFHLHELRAILRFDRFEFALAGVTAVVVALVGIEQGVVVATVLALAQRTRLAARPRDAVLGREPGTDHWILTDVGRPTEEVPGVVVYLLYAPLWYGNANYVAGRLRNLLEASPTPVHAFVLDANGVADIDYTGALVLGQLATELRAKGVSVGVARTSHMVHHDLEHSGLLEDIGPERLFATVQDAVEALGPGPDAAA